MSSTLTQLREFGPGARVGDLLGLEPGPVVAQPQRVDVPRRRVDVVARRDLLALLGAMPADGIAIAPAPDGTTNAIALAKPGLFAPLYGPGSAARFLKHASERGIEAVELDIPGIARDVDTPAELAQRVR